MAKILIVEDDDLLREAYKTKLSSSGFEVETSIDGKEALAKAREWEPDLIILDMMLPGMNGLEFLLKYDIRNRKYPTKVIAYSVLDSLDTIKEATVLGVSHYLTKHNVTPNELVGEIEKLLKTEKK